MGPSSTGIENAPGLEAYIKQLLELLMKEKSNKLGSNLNLGIYSDLEESLGA